MRSPADNENYALMVKINKKSEGIKGRKFPVSYCIVNIGIKLTKHLKLSWYWLQQTNFHSHRDLMHSKSKIKKFFSLTWMTHCVKKSNPGRFKIVLGCAWMREAIVKNPRVLWESWHRTVELSLVLWIYRERFWGTKATPRDFGVSMKSPEYQNMQTNSELAWS